MIKAFMICMGMLLASGVQAKTKQIVLNEDNVIYFGQQFNFRSVAVLQKEVAERNERLPAHKPLYIIIDSGGGGITAGLELISNLSSMKRKIHTITLFAASMAFQTVQGLGERYIIRDGTLMSHKARGGFSGEFGTDGSQLDKRYQFWLRRIKRLDEITVKRSGGGVTLEQYQKLYENEYWCDGEDCVKDGFADAVVDVVCDESLSGVEDKETVFMWRGRALNVVVNRSKCPMITGFLDIRVRVNGKPLLKSTDYDRYYSGKEDDRYKINQQIWDFVYRKFTKKEIPDRVIYLEVPKASNVSMQPMK